MSEATNKTEPKKLSEKMAEKKAKKLKDDKKDFAKNQNQVKELFKLEIVGFDDGSMNVNGPINDPLLIMKLLSGAMNVVVDHNFKQIEQMKNNVKSIAKEGPERKKIITLH